jgi:urease accessory protein
MSISVLSLVLVDSRLPTGAHAHSGGTEQAIDDGLIRDIESLRSWLEGRLATTIALDTHGAAVACAMARTGADATDYEVLTDELDARMPSRAARQSSRRQGEQYRRTTSVVLASPDLHALGRSERPAHLCTAVGVAAAAAGLGPREAAAIAAYQAVAAGASAALRLLGLDPVAVALLLASLAPACDSLAAAAAAVCGDGPGGLPANAAPVLDRLIEVHSAREERLFAS